MKKIILVTLISLCPGFLFADTIENEIGSYQQNSIVNKIAGGRQMLLEKLKAEDIQKAREVYDYLETKIDTTTYTSFYQGEEYKLAILLKRYDILQSSSIIESMVTMDKVKSQQKIVPPPSDGLSKELDNIIKERQDKILSQSKEVLNDEETDFLKLLIICLTYEDTKEAQEKENQSADEFLKKYPASKYNHFIRSYIRYVLKQGNKGWGIYMGLGRMGMNGNIANSFSNETEAELGFDFFYNKLLFTIDMAIGFAKDTKQSFVYGNDSWPKNTSTVLTMMGFETGYKIPIKKIDIYPYLGYIHHSFDADQSVKNRGFATSRMDSDSISYGINFDIKLKDHPFDYYTYGQPMTSKLRIKLAFSEPHYSENIKGQVYRFSVVYCMTFWPITRDY